MFTSNTRSRRLTLVGIAAATAALLAAGTGIAHAAQDGDSDGPATMIVGGHAATEAYPAMASLQTTHRGDPAFHFCAATLVSRTWAVTNAHCVTRPTGEIRPPDSLRLRIGSADRTAGGVLVGVTAVLPHASWDWATGTGPVADIAMLRLDSYVQLQHIEIATKIGGPRTVTRLLGWGLTEPDGSGTTPLGLQELDTRVVAAQRCADAFIGVGELCIANAHGTDGACNGDSGGPALQRRQGRWQVVGGASRHGAQYCGAGSAVYTDLSHYRPWTYKVMQTGTVPPAAPGEEATVPNPAGVSLAIWNLPTP